VLCRSLRLAAAASEPRRRPAELETILLAPFSCGTSPCIDPIFGPTAAFFYWSATTSAGNPNGAWLMFFNNGLVTVGINKNNAFSVRAVRTGS
jgi:hypothetical protein